MQEINLVILAIIWVTIIFGCIVVDVKEMYQQRNTTNTHNTYENPHVSIENPQV